MMIKETFISKRLFQYHLDLYCETVCVSI